MPDSATHILHSRVSALHHLESLHWLVLPAEDAELVDKISGRYILVCVAAILLDGIYAWLPDRCNLLLLFLLLIKCHH